MFMVILQVVEQLRQMQEEARLSIREQQTLPAWCEHWAQETARRLQQDAQQRAAPGH
ncbi:L-seryl-tRNA(Sec) selenium transferase [Kluyvera cryocrescens]|uniref:L-seryl-tRNA(Sec) selenium transferase n=1 Tax=Kluyvera cryocrescens TaxID=580 RepID=A0A485AKR3_KLUCR|nr:L-seryl-tRNA(Sec) selenium transferase [Kluyvera cryocrescens]